MIAPAPAVAASPLVSVREWILAEIRGHSRALDIGERGRTLGDVLLAEPELPGVLLAEGGATVGAISRRGYLDLIGRYCGMDLYHPRPLRLMAERLERERGGMLTLDRGTDIATAVRRGLDRPRELVYEPILVTGAGSPTQLVDFEDVLLADSERTALRNEQMRQILATVREGLLLVGRDGTIGPERSAASASLLGREDLAGRRFDRLIAELAGPDLGELTTEYLETLFAPRVIESLIGQINPLDRVEVAAGSRRGRVLSFRFVRGVVEGEIRHVLVHVEDVTAREELAHRVDEERRRADERLELALALVGADGEAVVALLGAIDDAVRQLGALAEGSGELDAARRLLHRLKGEAGLLGLDALRDLVHEAEDTVADTSPQSVLDLTAASDRLFEAGAILRELVDRFAGLGRVALPNAAARIAGGRGPVSSGSNPPSGSPGAGASFRAELVWRVERLVASVAQDLGLAARLDAEVDDAGLGESFRDLLRIAIPQLVRNSLAHGIEPPEERLAAGKDPTGTVRLRVRAREGWHELVVQDDGRGLDVAALRRRAVERGVPAELLDDPAALMFLSGFSTADTAGLHAGRGVGLDLVAAETRARGGAVEVHGTPGAWCAVRILLPRASMEGS